MPNKNYLLQCTRGQKIEVDLLHSITPQQSPTSDRIKLLLSKGLMAPQTLTYDEIQELSASVVYDLITRARS